MFCEGKKKVDEKRSPDIWTTVKLNATGIQRAQTSNDTNGTSGF